MSAPSEASETLLDVRDAHARWHDMPGSLYADGECGYERCDFVPGFEAGQRFESQRWLNLMVQAMALQRGEIDSAEFRRRLTARAEDDE